jgi:hypothetical protein
MRIPDQRDIMKAESGPTSLVFRTGALAQCPKENSMTKLFKFWLPVSLFAIAVALVPSVLHAQAGSYHNARQGAQDNAQHNAQVNRQTANPAPLSNRSGSAGSGAAPSTASAPRTHSAHPGGASGNGDSQPSRSNGPHNKGRRVTPDQKAGKQAKPTP